MTKAEEGDATVGARLILGDCIEAMSEMPDDSIDAVVCDPPYSLGFMGREWDTHDGEGEDASLGYWLAGLVDGEGHFRVQRQSRGTYSCAFSIKMRDDDIAALKLAQRFLGVGSITHEDQREGSRPQAKLVVQAKRDCLRVVEVFTRYPLRAKKLRDFLPWAEAVVEWNEMKRGHRWSGRADWRRMEALKSAVERAREYRDVPWSGHSAQDWHRTWAEEALRVLKPGGHLLAFGGTRTYHRLASAIEDAGFEIRDCIAWLYGCLTEDAETLTEHGWKLGVDISEGERVAQWDAASDSITLVPVERVIRALYAGPMRWLRNADTDQVVTPNHRVYHETRPHTRKPWPGGWSVSAARDVTRWAPTRLPVGGFADGHGIGGVAYAELLAFVWTEGSLDKTGSGVRVYQSPSANPETTRRIDRLIAGMAPEAKRYDRERVYRSRVSGPVLAVERTWFFTGPLAERVRRDLPSKQPTYELLWRMTLAEKVAFLDAAMAGDGSGSQFEQRGRAPLEWFQTLAHLIGWSARVRMRRDRDTGSCALRRSRTTEMQARHFQAAPDVYYEGTVWCVQVPTGAFVARRNGLVFVTGNSGFPKSHDVSKAIDEAAGAAREVVGERPIAYPDSDTWGTPNANSDGDGDSLYDGGWQGTARGGTRPVTVPATEDAARWEGWGTALKPAHEPVVVARKPLVGSVAANVLEHGTGALNVDGCRIGAEERLNAAAGNKPGGASLNMSQRGMPEALPRQAAGRWPANVALGHLPECEGETAKHTDVLCAPGCPVAELNRQSGERPSSGARVSDSKMFSGLHAQPAVVTGRGDAGGAARFFYIAKAKRRERIAGTIRNLHPTVKPVELMRWLTRLVTPRGGIVLDPFLGSGSTGCAAMAEGFRFIGIEQDEESFDTALERIADWSFAHGRERPLAVRPETVLAAAERAAFSLNQGV